MDTIIEEPIIEPEIEETSRKLASIQRIKAISPIVFTNKETGLQETAANIEHAQVEGWWVIVKKGLKVDEFVCYFEIDSVLPFQPWSEFLKDKNRPERPIKLKTAKRLGALSQGLIIPISELPELNGIELVEGMNVTKELGVIKYEPPCDVTLRGLCRSTRPGWVKKTDEDRLQSNLNYIPLFFGKQIYYSQKMDGSSGSFGFHNLEFHACSRNMDMLEVETNAFWRIAKKYNIAAVLEKYYQETGVELVIQGEVCGEGIQKNPIGLKGIDFYVFNITKIHGDIDFSLDEMINFCNDNGLKTVPILKRCVFDYKEEDAVEKLLAEADTYTYPNGRIGEGIVIRPIIPEKHPRTGGRLSFKVISNKFLLKNDSKED